MLLLLLLLLLLLMLLLGDLFIDAAHFPFLGDGHISALLILLELQLLLMLLLAHHPNQELEGTEPHVKTLVLVLIRH